MLDRQVHEFWFGLRDDPSFGQMREEWFAGGPPYDAAIRERFLDATEQAIAGAFDEWRADPTATMALCLLLDQFPRNLFRGTPRAFAGDARAREVADGAIRSGFERTLADGERMFLYLPFQHSEDLDDQRRSVALTQTLSARPVLEPALRYAILHLHVIERFGRFPHRNAMLGRRSTPEEEAYLAAGGITF